jgi:uncharacterized protein (TIGR02118 family)
MIKIISLLKAKPGMSQEAFRNYYETRHAPLAQRLLPTITHYRRNYVQEVGGRKPIGAGDFGFDVITEYCFEDEAGYKAFQDALRNPAIVDRIKADEANFMDTSNAWRLVVQEIRLTP